MNFRLTDLNNPPPLTQGEWKTGRKTRFWVRKIGRDVMSLDSNSPSVDANETADKPPVKCPHCGGSIGFRYVSHLADESRMSFVLRPAPGERMNAKNVGGAIEQFGKLLVACGREMGTPTQVLVENIVTDEQGAITVNVLIARHDSKVRKRKT